MFLSLGLCFILAVEPTIQIPHTDTDYHVKERKPRGLPAAIRNLLKTSRRYLSRDTMFSYFKTGGRKQAEKDFKKLNPKKVKDFGEVIRGKVGEDEVELDPTGSYTILRILSKGEKTDGKRPIIQHKIFYTSNKNKWS